MTKLSYTQAYFSPRIDFA